MGVSSFTWQQFRLTQPAQDAIRDHGEVEVRRAFDAMAGGDRVVVPGEVRSPAPDAVTRDVMRGLRRGFRDIGVSLRRAPLLQQQNPQAIRDAERDIGRHLSRLGIFDRVEVTGFSHVEGQPARLTEVQLVDVSPEDYADFQRARGAARALAAPRSRWKSA